MSRALTCVKGPGTHITLCRFDRRIPPLKIARASPMLHMAYPGTGWCVNGLVSYEAQQFSMHADLDVEPVLRTRWHDLKPSQAIMQEGLSSLVSHKVLATEHNV